MKRMKTSDTHVEEEERVLALIQQAQELTTNDKNKELLAEVIEAVSANYLGLISTGRMESDLMRSAVAKDGYLWKKGKKEHEKGNGKDSEGKGKERTGEGKKQETMNM